MLEAVIIINSKNKQTKFQKRLYDVCKVLTKKKYKINIRLTTKPHDTYEIVRANLKCDLLVIAGGDGSINEVVNALGTRENKPKIMYFPTGTVNDFGISLRIPKRFSKQLSLLKKLNTKKIDSGKVNNDYFNYICAFGPFTKASYLTPHIEKNRFGIWAYYRYVIKDIPQLRKKYKLEIEVDDQVIKGEYVMGLIVNSRSVAGFRNFLKNDKLDDGYFNLILLNADNIGAVPKRLSYLRRNKHQDIKEGDFVFYKFKKLKIKTFEDVQWIIDGEKGPVGSIEVKVIKHNLEIVVP